MNALKDTNLFKQNTCNCIHILRVQITTSSWTPSRTNPVNKTKQKDYLSTYFTRQHTQEKLSKEISKNLPLLIRQILE